MFKVRLNLKTISALIAFSLVILPQFYLLEGQAQGAKAAAKIVIKKERQSIRVPPRVRAKMKDFTQVLQMVKLTPLVNDQEEVVGVELNEISEKDITTVLKAQNGDVVKEVRVFRKKNGKVETTTYPITSASDIMGMYSALQEATSVDVDLKRGKTILPMTYVLD
ncbi:MAG: hypothetical protein U1E10_10430 [Bdellovibrionales bacterium]|nr:hypothetical protein [Bdellovibrionales bacterium]